MSSTGSYASGSSSSNTNVCSNCRATCFQSCAKVCTAQKAAGAVPDCATNCIGACKSNCFGSCGSGCADTCTGGCKTSCSDYCGQHCWSACSYGCGDGCTGKCTGKCTGTCKGTCVGNSGGGCFDKGTRILTGNCTWKKIEDIRIGDLVMSYDINTNTFSPQRVSKAYEHNNTAKMIKVYLSNGIVLKLTPGHPLLTTDGWKSRDIQNSLEEHNTIATLLKVGDILVGYEDNIKIDDIKDMDIPNNYTTYNAEVDTYHTFIAEGIVAHNMKTEY